MGDGEIMYRYCFLYWYSKMALKGWTAHLWHQASTM